MALAGCAVAPPPEYRAQRTWIFWAVQQDHIYDPEVLRPVQAFPTQRQCEQYELIVTRNQLDRNERSDRENRERAARGGAFVKALREKRGWSQEELAEHAGLKPNDVADLESPRSQYSFSHDRAFKLALGLDVNVGELAKWSWQPPTNIVSQLQCWRTPSTRAGRRGSDVGQMTTPMDPANAAQLGAMEVGTIAQWVAGLATLAAVLWAVFSQGFLHWFRRPRLDLESIVKQSQSQDCAFSAFPQWCPCTAPGFLDTSGGCQGMTLAPIVDPGATERSRSRHDHRYAARAAARAAAGVRWPSRSMSHSAL